MIKILHESNNSYEVSELLSCYAIVTKGKDTWYGLYATLALEAFQYEAATGSIKSIEWFLLCYRGEYLSDFREKYYILLDFGFTFYNFTRDLKYRYGALNDELFSCFHKQLVVYKALVTSLPKSSSTRFLLVLVTLIYSEFQLGNYCVPNTKDFYQAKFLTKDVACYQQYYEDEKQPMPAILCGINFRQCAKRYDYIFTSLWRLAPVQLYANSIVLLRTYADKSHSTASYFYDVIAGTSLSKI